MTDFNLNLAHLPGVNTIMHYTKRDTENTRSGSLILILPSIFFSLSLQGGAVVDRRSLSRESSLADIVEGEFE